MDLCFWRVQFRDLGCQIVSVQANWNDLHWALQSFLTWCNRHALKGALRNAVLCYPGTLLLCCCCAVDVVLLLVVLVVLGFRCWKKNWFCTSDISKHKRPAQFYNLSLDWCCVCILWHVMWWMWRTPECRGTGCTVSPLLCCISSSRQQTCVQLVRGFWVSGFLGTSTTSS